MGTEFKKYNVTAVLFFITIIIVAHLVAVDDYNWRNNAVSELASQGYTRKWIMQIGFVVFGAILILTNACI